MNDILDYLESAQRTKRQVTPFCSVLSLCFRVEHVRKRHVQRMMNASMNEEASQEGMDWTASNREEQNETCDRNRASS